MPPLSLQVPFPRPSLALISQLRFLHTPWSNRTTMSRLLATAVARSVSQVVSLVVLLLVGYIANRITGVDGWVGKGDTHAPIVRSLVEDCKGAGAASLEDIGGYEDVKTDLRRCVVLPMRNPHIFFDRGAPSLRPPAGILLTGPPGTGKTLLARACAKESGANFLPLHSAALESKWWGESPKLLQMAFQMARTTLAPCIIFFDEIDGLGRKRSEQDQSCVYSFKCELLRNMDGLGKVDSSPVAVLACTNCPSSLDPALRRRFTRTISVSVPTEPERRAILAVLARDEQYPDADLLDHVVKCTEGFTGADLTTLHTEACAHRMWRFCENEEDVGRLKSGVELVGRMSSLTREDWVHTRRVRLPCKHRLAVGGSDSPSAGGQ